MIDEDREYARALTETIACLHRGFRIVTLGRAPEESSLRSADAAGTDCEATAEFPPSVMRAMEESDVVLADASFARSLSAEQGVTQGLSPDCAEKLIVLSDGDVPDRFTAVDRYGGCAAIIAAVRLKYAQITGKPFIEPSGGTKAAILSFFSAEGGAGTSSAALGTARELSGYRNKKVVYISMEPFESGRLCLKERTTRGDISDYIYCLLKGEHDRLRRFRDALMDEDHYGVRRFYPAEGFNTLRELNAEELSEFINGFITEGKADYLIIDWGDGFGGMMADYLPLSQWSVMVTRQDSVKSNDCAAWRRLMAATLGLSRDNFMVVVNFADDETEDAREEAPLSEAQDDSESPRVIRIGRDLTDFRDAGRGIEIGLMNEFGRGIKSLADRITGTVAADEERAVRSGGKNAEDIEAGGNIHGF
jgi:MinD-like ATPase involved in chromosome partitioning or flagellar assembly